MRQLKPETPRLVVMQKSSKMELEEVTLSLTDGIQNHTLIKQTKKDF